MPATLSFAKRDRAAGQGGTLWTSKPTTLYLGLLKAQPTSAGVYVELTGKGYARKAITASDWHVYNNVAINAATINWPTPATDDWDQVTHLGIFTAATGGELLLYGTLASAQTVTKLGTFSLDAGKLRITGGGAKGLVKAHKLLRYIFKNVAFTFPGTLYAGIGTNADNGQLYGEPIALVGASATGYARGTIGNTTKNWPADTTNAAKALNGVAVTAFGTAATADWGQLSNAALLDGAIVTGATYAQSSGSATIVVSKTGHGLTITNPNFASQAGTYGRSGTTVTITTDQPHGYAVGERVYADFAAGTGGTATDGCWLITAVTDTTITLTDPSSGTITAGTVTINRPQHVDVFFTGGTSVAVSRRYWIANLGDASNGVGVAGASTADKFTIVADADDTLPGGSLTGVACNYSAANVWVQGAMTSQITINTGDSPTVPVNALGIQIEV